MVAWFQKSCLAVQNDSAQAIFLFGDLAYADDYNGHNTGQRNGYQPRWDTWGQMMQPIISHLPFISLMGTASLASSVRLCSNNRFLAMNPTASWVLFCNPFSLLGLLTICLLRLGLCA